MAPFFVIHCARPTLFRYCREKAVNKVTSRSGTETYMSTPWFYISEQHMNLDHGLAASSWKGLSALVDLRVKHIPQPVTQQVDHQHQHHQADAREGGDPPGAGEDVVEAHADQRPQ